MAICKAVDFNMTKFITGFAPVVKTGEQDCEEYINKLYNNQAPIEVKDKTNQTYLNRIMENVSLIQHIQLPPMELNTDIFTAERIKTEKDDNNDIKKLIRKINMKVGCHTCDHTKFEKLKLQYCKDMSELRKSKNLDKVHRYYKSMASDCHILVDMETPNKKVKCEVIDNMYHSINDTHELKQVQQAAIDFQTEVITLKSKYLATHCPKCEKLQKEYEYILNEIQDMREEIKEQREAEIERVKAEIENPPIIDFMNKYFEGKTRIKLGDVAKMWKADKGKSIKQDDLAEMLEESGKWWVGNSHNLRYANYGQRPEKDNE